MNVTTKIEQKLRDDTINWDTIRAMLPQAPKGSNDRLLLAVIKHVDVLPDIVLILARNAKLKTLRKAFDQACCQKLMPIHIITILLNEMLPLPTEMRELCLRTSLRCHRSEVTDILIKMEGDFLTPSFAIGTFEENDDFHRLANMILKSDIIVLRNDIFSNSNIIHQFVIKGRVDIVEWIVNTFPTSVQTQDENKNLPLHYALENKQLSMASFLVEKGTKIGFKFGGLLVKNCKNVSPLICALKSRDKDQCSSGETQNTFNILQWLQSIGLLNDAIIINDVIKFAIENGYDEIANRLFQNNVKRIGSTIMRTLKKLTKERKMNHNTLVRFIHTNNIKNEKNWMGPFFHRIVSDGQIENSQLLIISNPLLLQSKDGRGKLPIHRACSTICDESLSLIILLFEEAQRCDRIKMSHAGMFEPDNNGTTPLDILFRYFELNSLEMHNMIHKVLQKMLDIDRSLPVVPYVLQHTNCCFDILYDHLLHDSCLRWDPLAKYNGRNALFYGINRLMAKRDDKVGPFLKLCYDRNSQWHACLEASDDEGQLPLHYALRSPTPLPSKIIIDLVTSNLKSLGEIDGVSGLYPALLGAAHCDLETIYELLRSYSQIIQL
jgi:ankyrin repeat protein